MSTSLSCTFGELYYAKYMPIDISASRQHIMEFLNKNHVGVLATADKSGQPHAATVYLTFDQQLNLYFVTKKETQKSHNLRSNPKAAVAIHDAVAQTTVQAEGSVSEVTEPDQQERVFNDIWDIAFRVSRTGPPTTQVNAGGYIVYKLPTPSLRIARFTVSVPNATNEKIFETVHAQPPQDK